MISSSSSSLFTFYTKKWERAPYRKWVVFCNKAAKVSTIQRLQNKVEKTAHSSMYCLYVTPTLSSLETFSFYSQSLRLSLVYFASPSSVCPSFLRVCSGSSSFCRRRPGRPQSAPKNLFFIYSLKIKMCIRFYFFETHFGILQRCKRKVRGRIA